MSRLNLRWLVHVERNCLTASWVISWGAALLLFSSVRAADAIPDRLKGVAVKYAAKFLAAEEKDKALQIDAFLKTEQISGAAAAAVKTAAAYGRQLKTDGLTPGTDPFDTGMREGFGVPALASGPIGPGTPTPPPAPPAPAAPAPAVADDGPLMARAKEKLVAKKKEKDEADTAAKQQPADNNKAALATKANLDYRLALSTYNNLTANAKDYPAQGPSTFVHGGVRLLSPYKFVAAGKDTAGVEHNARIEKTGSSDTANFLEFVYANRWAWNPRLLKAKFDQDSEKPTGLARLLQSFDFESRVTYNFSSADSDAVAIAGSGDFGVEVSIAPLFPFAYHLHDSKEWRSGGWSVAPEFSYGAVTDKNFLQSRRRIFYGGGYTTSLNLGTKPEPLWLQFSIRMGWAYLDSLKYISEENADVATIHGGLPLYSLRQHRAIEADVIYPFGVDSHLTFGGRIYTARRPNSWTLYLGYTRPINDFVKGLFATVGLGESGGGGTQAPPSTPPSAPASGDPTPAAAPSTTQPTKGGGRSPKVPSL